MALNVVASTSSALAAGLLRFELAGARAAQAAAAHDPALAPGEADDAGTGALPLYDARGRTAAPASDAGLVTAVGELLRAKQGVEVDAAVLKRVLDTQGNLLDVFA
jgi:hypothetical protein